MGKGDRRHSNKAKQRASQRKLKARIKKRVLESKARHAGAEKTEKKRAPRKASAASSS